MIKKVGLDEFRCPADLDVKEFLKTDWDACEVDFSHYKGIRTAATAYGTAAKKLNANIRVTERNGKLYLIKNEL